MKAMKAKNEFREDDVIIKSGQSRTIKKMISFKLAGQSSNILNRIMQHHVKLKIS